MVFGDEDKRLPVYALSYNHRAAAFYRADSENSTNVNVDSVRKRGLKRVRVLAAWTPEFVLRFMCSVHNRFHRGSGATVLEICKTALELEASWRAACDHSGMTSNNPGYYKAYEDSCCLLFQCECDAGSHWSRCMSNPTIDSHNIASFSVNSECFR